MYMTGLGHTGTSPTLQPSVSQSSCVLTPREWDTTGHVHNRIGTHRDVPYITALCVQIQLCPDLSVMGHNGACTQLDWDTQGRPPHHSPLCPGPILLQSHGKRDSVIHLHHHWKVRRKN